jgi:integrase
MSLKGQKTTAEYLKWKECSTLLIQLQRDNDFKFCLLIAIGTFFGLTIADILNLKWIDLIEKTKPELKIKNNILIIEKRTRKERKIKLNPDIKKIIKECFLGILPNKKDFIFTNKNNEVFSIQFVNQKLKSIKIKYHLSLDKFSTHTFRKTFGIQVLEENGYSEKALILLSDLFNHSNKQITKRYLGIKEKEISKNVYDSITLNL